ncbi:uncharacterized protein LOC135947543 [Cloeon dipterum]|uniref:uncharacterized protein LOC135947543 n=1 Tax=Cloeon dipterum TaxID=197152 RepID=UPI00321FC116
MKVFAVLLLAVAAANATFVPAVNTAYVTSGQVGGAFAYTVAENKVVPAVAPLAYSAYTTYPYAYNYGVFAPAEVKAEEAKPVEVKVEAKAADMKKEAPVVGYYGAYPYAAYPSAAAAAYPYNTYAYGAAYPYAAYPYSAYPYTAFYKK